MLSIVEKRNDGWAVVAGVHPLVGTHGLPLEDILIYLHQNKMIVDWIDYIVCARRDGASFRTIKAKIEAAASEVYKHAEFDQFMERLNKVITL